MVLRTALERLKSIVAHQSSTPAPHRTITMPELESLLEQAVGKADLPQAVVFATNSSGSFTYKHAAGYTTLDQSTPIGLDAQFQMASSTKLLTTIAMLHAVEHGLVGLDDDVTPKIPELAAFPIIKGFDENDKPILVQRKNPITLRHLLTHSSGVSYDESHPYLLKWQDQHGRPYRTGTTIRERYNHPSLFEPGEGWTYGAGLDWSSILIENLTGQTLEEYMRKNLWGPIGATRLTFWPARDAVLDAKVPQLTVRTPEGKLAPFADPFLNTGSTDCFGGHGISAAIEDFLKVLRSILANDGNLLKPETVEMMFHPQLSAKSVADLDKVRQSIFGSYFAGDNPGHIKANWGLGGLLFLEDHEGRRKKGTLSWGGMTNTFWLIDREADFALAFGTQVLPPGDTQVSNVIKEIELALYERAGVKF